MTSPAAARIAGWRADPVRFVREVFRVEPDAWQADVLRALADPSAPRIAMQACAGPGKSTVLAWAGWWFLVCCGDGHEHPNGAAVSITADNLKNNLWKELALWRDRATDGLLVAAFDMTSEMIVERDHPKTWYLSARSFPKTADREAQGRTLSGLHAAAILYLVDESGDMPPAVGRAAEQGLGNCHWGKILQAGNPTSQDGMLFESVTAGAHQWRVFRITGDPDDPQRSPRIKRAWAEEQIAKYGRDNPWVMAYILGLFPPSSLNALLGPDEVRAAMARHLREDDYSFSQKRIGVDVARFGDDATVLFPRQGLAARRPVEIRNARTNEIAARLAQAKARWGSELELIDDTGGWGAGVVDQCLLAGIPLVPVNFAGKADDPRYFNKRTEMYFRAAEWVKAGGALPPIPELVREATATTYWFDKGKMRVEEKDQVKAKLGKSPDHWDAFVLTFALADQPSITDPVGRLLQPTAGKALSDWDPNADV